METLKQSLVKRKIDYIKTINMAKLFNSVSNESGRQIKASSLC